MLGAPSDTTREPRTNPAGTGLTHAGTAGTYCTVHRMTTPPLRRRRTTPAPRRRRVTISGTLFDQFLAKAEQRHDIGSHVIKDIVRAAKRAADAGIPLPPGRKGRPAEPPMPADPKDAPWTQHPEEFQLCEEAIEAAESSVRAVVTFGVQAYVDDPREVLPVDWTPFLAPKSRHH